MKRNRKIGTKTVFVAETKGEKESENKRIEIGIRKGRGRIITREEEGITTNIVTSRMKEVGERKERRSRETTEQNKSTTKHNI